MTAAPASAPPRRGGRHRVRRGGAPASVQYTWRQGACVACTRDSLHCQPQGLDDRASAAPVDFDDVELPHTPLNELALVLALAKHSDRVVAATCHPTALGRSRPAGPVVTTLRN